MYWSFEGYVITLFILKLLLVQFMDIMSVMRIALGEAGNILSLFKWPNTVLTAF